MRGSSNRRSKARFLADLWKRASACFGVLGSKSMSPIYLGGCEVEGFLLPSGWLGHSSQTTGTLVIFSRRSGLEEAAPLIHNVAVEAYGSSCTWSQRKLWPRQISGILCRYDLGEVDFNKREIYILVAPLLQLAR
jgi:hypothetical protein